ncbi:hypothetical protein GCM10010116_40130 [Microbispora rosea subsp. aerata]|nr:hypothetical protein [Microbispora rosea]GGO20008.1 hypothetical protein GCM10010116_40130 [Microbispora rosea subsp. aerata]GIH57058.1 hypothetical protein Mro02_39720 [Microbispora rosea subsp. aerata]GLJ83515.1 hypothetical protein GCM10017588_22430 [Microbispora rosea subsp. aerata]
MTRDHDDLHRLVAAIAPDPGPGMTPTALELLEEIVSGPAPAPRRRRATEAVIGAARAVLRGPRLVPVIVALTAVLLAVGWLVPGAPGLGPAPASAALEIKRDGDHYVVMFRDLYAAPASYQRELRQRGLDVDVRLVPAAAASAGRVVYFDGTRDLSAIKPIKAPGECVRPFGCPIGFRIPVGFRGHATVLVGRPARPGERHGFSEAVDMEGRPFHCVDYVNKTVARVLPLLRERDVRAEFVSYTFAARPSAPADWYVHEGVMVADGQALLLVNPTPNPRPRPGDAFCAERR